MSSLNISYLSKEYERFYGELILKNTLIDTVSVLNDLFIIAIKMTVENKQRNISARSFEQKDLYFSNISLFQKNIDIIEPIFSSIVNLVLGNKSLAVFEMVLGQVLEKHINRKDTGSYYTPTDTTNFICWNAIFISILNKIHPDTLQHIYQSLNISNNVEFVDKKNSFEKKITILKRALSEKEKAEIAGVLSNIRILEPTCGSGAFIISAYECIKYLNESLLNCSLSKETYFENIYGVDILEEAIMFSKTRLIIKAIIDNNYSDRLIHAIENNYISSDALSGSDGVIEGKSGLDWKGFGLFDCVIGNPPYVEIKDKSNFSHYKTQKCGNLYAYAIERACNLTKDGSVISFIVPLPLIATPRMYDVRELLERNSSVVYYCTFADRPGCLFTGVHQRLTIFFSSVLKNGGCRRFTSSYKFWYKDERNKLFESLDFIENNEDAFPKIGTDIERRIFNKVKSCTSSLIDIKDDEGNYPLYISSRIGFWAKAFIKKPITKEITEIPFASDADRRIAYCFVNSSLFYYIWVITSDCWHVTNSDLKTIKFNYLKLSKKQIEELIALSKELEEDLEKNKVRINSKQTEFEYKHKYSKDIIDKIDDVLCLNCGFDKKEIDFIKNYTLKYRLNKIM